MAQHPIERLCVVFSTVLSSSYSPWQLWELLLNLLNLDHRGDRTDQKCTYYIDCCPDDRVV